MQIKVTSLQDGGVGKFDATEEKIANIALWAKMDAETVKATLESGGVIFTSDGMYEAADNN